jgi:hypothetical protein
LSNRVHFCVDILFIVWLRLTLPLFLSRLRVQNKLLQILDLPRPHPAPALSALAHEVAPRVVLSHVQAECLLARQLVLAQVEVPQRPQLLQLRRDGP